jgi:hypothetical protein
MTDRELLELAAKAAGEWSRLEPLEHLLDRWNPLTDDGDAFRLAVKLELNVLPGIARTPDGDIHFDKDMDDPYAATRRAIVLAAAEIGKNMP